MGVIFSTQFTDSKSGPLDIGVDLASSELFSFPLAIGAEFKESIFAPVGSPWVLDKPVLVAAFYVTFAVADYSNSVVNVIFNRVAATAIAVMDNARRVALEAPEVWVHGNTNGALWDQLLETIIAHHVFFVAGCVVETMRGLVYLWAFSLAALISSWVVFPRNDAVGFGKFVRVSHPTTITTPVDFVAVEEVLDGVAGYLLQVVLNCVQTLESRRSRESPTWATASLVDGLGNLAGFKPIYLFWKVACTDHMRSSLNIVPLRRRCQNWLF